MDLGTFSSLSEIVTALRIGGTAEKLDDAITGRVDRFADPKWRASAQMLIRPGRPREPILGDRYEKVAVRCNLVNGPLALKPHCLNHFSLQSQDVFRISFSILQLQTNS